MTRENEYPEFQRGDRKIPALFLNAVTDHLGALRDPFIPDGGLDFDVPTVPPPVREHFRAVITAKDASANPAYSWTLLDDLDLGYTAISGLTAVNGGPAAPHYPAYEDSGNFNVPVDGTAVVRLFPSPCRKYYTFTYPRFGGAVTGDVTYLSGSDSVYQTGSTVTFQSGSSLTLNSGSTLTSSATVSITGGTWTYGTTAVAATPPTSRLVIPTLTVAGPPTYAGIIGEILCGGDKVYQYGPTGWVAYTSSAATLDIIGLTAAIPDGADSMPFYDASAAANRRTTIDELLGSGPFLCEFRLCTESDRSVSGTDQTAKGNLYLVPLNQGPEASLNGYGRVRLYDGAKWKLYLSQYVALSLAGIASGTNYDVYLYAVGSVLTLETLAWTSDTARATSLTLVSGAWVKNGDTTRLYVGTIRGSGAGVTEDSLKKRFVWSAYNQILRPLAINDATLSWTYSTAAWRQARAQTANQVEVVTGLVGHNLLWLEALSFYASTAASIFCMASIGEDSTTTPTTTLAARMDAQVANLGVTLTAKLTKYPAVGYHKYCWLEYGGGSGTQTFFGTATDQIKSGLAGWVAG